MTVPKTVKDSFVRVTQYFDWPLVCPQTSTHYSPLSLDGSSSPRRRGPLSYLWITPSLFAVSTPSVPRLTSHAQCVRAVKSVPGRPSDSDIPQLLSPVMSPADKPDFPVSQCSGKVHDGTSRRLLARIWHCRLCALARGLHNTCFISVFESVNGQSILSCVHVADVENWH